VVFFFSVGFILLFFVPSEKNSQKEKVIAWLNRFFEFKIHSIFFVSSIQQFIWWKRIMIFSACQSVKRFTQ
jgi:hypothetical protein